MKSALFLLFLSLTVMGCAAKGTSVILLENPDGSVGKVQVKSQGGNQTLSAARQGTTVPRPSDPPSAPRIVAQEEIDRDYGQAMRALPEAPDYFLLYFDSGTAKLTQESLAMPEKILASIGRRGSRDVRVNGHTDRQGKNEDNARLSMQRAEFVRDFLITKGVESSIIQVFAHGEGNPIVPTDDEMPEPRNRRVEVLVR
jgi:outer membrane protein OmpA-like peptidoglycan-associated protein